MFLNRMLLAAPLLALSALSCATPPGAGPLLAGSSFTESAADLRAGAHLGFLASDALQGRDTGTPFGDVTAHYVASVFQGLGLEATDAAGLMLPYPLTRSRINADGCSLALEGSADEPWILGQDYVPRGMEMSGYDLSAGVVFVGLGVVDEDSGRNDFAGVDFDGRFALALMGTPGDEPRGPATSWRAQQDAAQASGAAGLLLAVCPGSKRGQQALGWALRSVNESQMALGSDEVRSEPFPRVYMTEELGVALLAAAGLDAEAEATARVADISLPAMPLEGVRVELAASVQVDGLIAHNVAGLLRGNDPELSHELVVLSAHMDHVGVDDEGNVFNGADDNASGTTALMLVAEALVTRDSRPRRSILFLAVSGEEKGLLGSEWWIKHPTWDLAQVVADVNTDMVGRNDSHSIGVTPSPEHPAYNTLVRRAVELGPIHGMSVNWVSGEGDYERRVDNYYSRSDHKHFTDAGIPVAFFFSGEHGDYHRISDTLDKIDLGKVRRVAGLVAELTAEVADADDRPQALAKPAGEPVGEKVGEKVGK